jgi:hypothetical protein
MIKTTIKFDDEEDELRWYEEEFGSLHKLGAAELKAAEAGKLSGEARRKKSDHAKLQNEYLSLRRKDLDRSDAMREIFRIDWVLSLPLTNSQIYKITGFAEKDFMASRD